MVVPCKGAGNHHSSQPQHSETNRVWAQEGSKRNQ
uniref:Uncharacterized protein n=1 Tax=Arundo donax TaxID=35708 RepID=A0A0A9FVN4_ARUDO